MKNRIKELRTRRGWSLDELARAVDETGGADADGRSTSASTMRKLESGEMRLTTEWVERIGRALGIDPIEILDDRPRLAARGFAEDAAPLDGQPPPARGGETPEHWRVLSSALDEIGIGAGDAVEVNAAPEARRQVVTGDVVIAEVEDDAGNAQVVMRQFVEPALLVTNSRTHNEMPINMRAQRVKILGVVTASRRIFRRPP